MAPQTIPTFLTESEAAEVVNTVEVTGYTTDSSFHTQNFALFLKPSYFLLIWLVEYSRHRLL